MRRVYDVVLDWLFLQYDLIFRKRELEELRDLCFVRLGGAVIELEPLTYTVMNNIVIDSSDSMGTSLHWEERSARPYSWRERKVYWKNKPALAAAWLDIFDGWIHSDHALALETGPVNFSIDSSYIYCDGVKVLGSEYESGNISITSCVITNTGTSSAGITIGKGEPIGVHFSGGSLGRIHEACPNAKSQVACPRPLEAGCVYESDWRNAVPNIVMHLNDDHGWTREQIADWLDSLDIDLTIDLHSPITEGAAS